MPDIYSGPGLHVGLVGMESLNRKLASIGSEWEQAANDATRQMAEEVLAGAQQRVAVLTGALRASGEVLNPEPRQYVVSFNKPYAKRIEYGFHGTDSRGRTYNQAAKPYLRPAYDEVRATAVERTVALIQRATAAGNR